jgi:hypothetical protein
VRAIRPAVNSAALIVGLTVAIAGCATATNWVKSGASQEDHAVDSYECQKDVRESGAASSAPGAADPYDRCMIAHGWSKHQ